MGLRQATDAAGRGAISCCLNNANSGKLTTSARTPASSVADESDRQLCLHQIFENWAARTPDAIAVAFGGQTLSYRALNRRANALALRLMQEDVRPGSLIGISMKRSLEMMVGLLAILKVGAAYVPLDHKLPRERLCFLVSDAALTHVLTNGTAPDIGQARIIDLAQDGATGGRAVSETDANPAPMVTNGDLVYVIYTSGSTGEPKGVMVPHQGVVNWLVWMRKVFAATPQDAVLAKAPLSFDVSAWELFLPLISGARLILADSDRQYDQRYLADLMAKTGVTIAQFVPSLMRAFLEQKTLPYLSSLRHVMCGGEALTPKLVSLFRERLLAELCNSYGPTEASIGVTRWVCRPDETRESVPIGYAIDNVELYILDGDLNLVPPGEPGELYVAGICLARGYLNRPELTAERFVANPFGGEGARIYRTGDLCRLLDDGSIDFLGRVDDQVKVRGVRIELPEVEKSLMTHPGVNAAAVTVDHVDETATLVAFVVPAAGQALTDRDLRVFLRQKLPLPMVPSEFYFVTSLPISANGKLDRKQLRIERKRAGTTERPGDVVDERVAAIWSEVLERDDFGPDDDFFDCGGDSFSAMQLYLSFEEEFGQMVDLEALGRLTITNLSRFIRDASARDSALSARSAMAQRIGGVVCRMATLDDLEGIWRVCAGAFPAYAATTCEDFEALCRHRWLNNPARTADDPFGWVLQADSGEIVGFHGLVPARLQGKSVV